jgi:hypothetical protein
MGLFDLSLIRRVQRNHGLEHATIHILNRRNGPLSLVGHSDWSGFTLYGPIDTAEVKYAAHEALRRLRQGEAELAVHPRCGTVIATTGILTGLAAFIAISLDSSRSRFRWAALPAALLGATLAAIFAQPVGLRLQERFTVTGSPGNLEIKNISVNAGSSLTVHRVETIQ